MSISCVDVCSDLVQKLVEAGYDVGDDEDHEPIMIALADAVLVNPEKLLALLKNRCNVHHLPLERDPQGDAVYSLHGLYHPIHLEPSPGNPSGIVYSRCGLTTKERDLFDEIKGGTP